jgi:hypothetical protein
VTTSRCYSEAERYRKSVDVDHGEHRLRNLMHSPKPLLFSRKVYIILPYSRIRQRQSFLYPMAGDHNNLHQNIMLNLHAGYMVQECGMVWSGQLIAAVPFQMIIEMSETRFIGKRRSTEKPIGDEGIIS